MKCLWACMPAHNIYCKNKWNNGITSIYVSHRSVPTVWSRSFISLVCANSLISIIYLIGLCQQSDLVQLSHWSVPTVWSRSVISLVCVKSLISFSYLIGLCQQSDLDHLSHCSVPTVSSRLDIPTVNSWLDIEYTLRKYVVVYLMTLLLSTLNVI
jgi:hypothetical protein